MKILRKAIQRWLKTKQEFHLNKGAGGEDRGPSKVSRMNPPGTMIN